MFRTPYPAPRIPPEFANLKRSEMPEPYKSEIDDYIAINKARFEADIASSKRLTIFVIVATVVFLMAAGVAVAAVLLVA